MRIGMFLGIAKMVFFPRTLSTFDPTFILNWKWNIDRHSTIYLKDLLRGFLPTLKELLHSQFVESPKSLLTYSNYLFVIQSLIDIHVTIGKYHHLVIFELTWSFILWMGCEIFRFNLERTKLWRRVCRCLHFPARMTESSDVS